MMSISTARPAVHPNGATSPSPATDEGKIRSAQNARKHGLFGVIHLHTVEEQTAFHELLEAYLEEYRPATIFETRCVREMANAEWRLAALRNTVSLLEATYAAQAPAGSSTEEACAVAFETMANTGQTLSVALRFEKHLQRQYEKAHRDLIESRRRHALDRQEIAHRTDQAMANILKSVMEAPVPTPRPMPNQNLQNEPKQPPPMPQGTPINPTIRV